MQKIKNNRTLAVASFSSLFAYLLSFLFDGQILNSLVIGTSIDPHLLVHVIIASHLIGLLFGGFIIVTNRVADGAMKTYMVVCMLLSFPFYFTAGVHWYACGAVAGFAAGIAVSAWGLYLKRLFGNTDRMNVCADCLIYSNLSMTIINLINYILSARIALFTATAMVVFGTYTYSLIDSDTKADNAKKPLVPGTLSRTLPVLCVFIAIVTFNTGLMYMSILPSFSSLGSITRWYWVLPYIAAILIMKSALKKYTGLRFLILAAGLLMLTFVAYLYLDIGLITYLTIDTMLLVALGILDLFWWSILSDMLDLTDRPAMVLGVGLSANVLGILLGSVTGAVFNKPYLVDHNFTIMALMSICLTLLLLPYLNHRLSMVLKKHKFLVYYSGAETVSKTSVRDNSTSTEPERVIPDSDELTTREKQILQLVLEGKTNRQIAEESNISENTVKTHLRNIYGKFEVNSKTELISKFLNAK